MVISKISSCDVINVNQNGKKVISNVYSRNGNKIPELYRLVRLSPLAVKDT